MRDTYKSSRIIKSISTLTIVLIFTKIIGFIRSVLTAYYFGAGSNTDSFFLANATIGNLNSIILAGIPAIIIPIYSNAISKGDFDKQNKLASSFMSLFTIVSIIIFGVFFISSDIISNFIAIGQPDAVKNQVSYILRLLSLIIPLAILTGYMSQLLNAEKKYIYPAIVSSTFSIISVVSIIIFKDKFGVLLLVYSMIAANLVNFLVLIVNNRKRLFHKIVIAEEVYLWKNTLVLMVPILLSSTTFEFQALIDRIAAGTLHVGAITSLSYANTIYTLVSSIFIASIVTVYFTELSINNAFKDKSIWKDNFNKAIEVLITLLLPISIFTFIYSEEIVTFVYYRGQFSYDAVVNTAQALKYYGVAFLVIGLSTFLNRAFHSLKMIRIPTIISLITVAINIGLTVILAMKLGLAGVTIATAIAESCGLIIKIILLNKKVYVFNSLRVFKLLLDRTGFSIVALLIVQIVGNYIIQFNSMFQFIINGVVFIASNFAFILLKKFHGNGAVTKE